MTDGEKWIRLLRAYSPVPDGDAQEAEHADKLGRSITATVKDYNTFVSSLETRVLVTARKLNDLDENALGTEEISAPKELDSAPQSLTASELTK